MIRKYQETDLAACAALYCAAFAGDPWNEQWTQEIAEKRIRELMCSPMSAGYVCEENGRLRGMAIGCSVTYLYGRGLVIHEFCVDPAAQRTGIGSEMLRYVCDTLKAEGYVGIFLNTRRGYPSEKFYLKNGFTRSEDMVSLYRSL